MDPKIKWNRKHTDRLNEVEEPLPTARLERLSTYLKGGSALDLACGLGGNSLFLARMNYEVQAIDISDVAVSYIKEQAAKQELAISPRVSDLTDLEQLTLEASSFDLGVITYYLDRAIFPLVKSIIKESGYFFMETFYIATQHGNQKVSNKYKLESNELLAEFRDWKILFYEENEQEGRQTIFCQKKQKDDL
ncbi:class I SAM-dependent methyltransferase [Mesobacillus harenae]|uniref:class I SAM-dependent methyltransferase n=1 Tax=Mesobacillus harenae TaxID=2213203 RepID=UPI00157FD9C9|nr:class I SAM-dependent methyltransferase [Mesobacillus harenae]